MQENITAARPYAQAVFAQAKEDNSLDTWSGNLNLLNMVVADPQMQVLLKNPTIKADVLAGIIVDICGDQIDDMGRNFIRVLASARRLPLTGHIHELYAAARAAAENTVEVSVSSAFQLEQTEIDRISDSMSKRLGKKVTVTTNIDKDLIGGVVIRAGDSVIDASVMGRLKQLGSHLAD